MQGLGCWQTLAGPAGCAPAPGQQLHQLTTGRSSKGTPVGCGKSQQGQQAVRQLRVTSYTSRQQAAVQQMGSSAASFLVKQQAAGTQLLASRSTPVWKVNQSSTRGVTLRTRDTLSPVASWALALCPTREPLTYVPLLLWSSRDGCRTPVSRCGCSSSRCVFLSCLLSCRLPSEQGKAFAWSVLLWHNTCGFDVHRVGQ